MTKKAVNAVEMGRLDITSKHKHSRSAKYADASPVPV